MRKAKDAKTLRKKAIQSRLCLVGTIAFGIFLMVSLIPDVLDRIICSVFLVVFLISFYRKNIFLFEGRELENKNKQKDRKHNFAFAYFVLFISIACLGVFFYSFKGINSRDESTLKAGIILGIWTLPLIVSFFYKSFSLREVEKKGLRMYLLLAAFSLLVALLAFYLRLP